MVFEQSNQLGILKWNSGFEFHAGNFTSAHSFPEWFAKLSFNFFFDKGYLVNVVGFYLFDKLGVGYIDSVTITAGENLIEQKPRHENYGPE